MLKFHETDYITYAAEFNITVSFNKQISRFFVGNSMKTVDHKLKKVLLGAIEPGRKLHLNDVSFKIPSVCPSLKGCSIIEIGYKLKVSRQHILNCRI